MSIQLELATFPITIWEVNPMQIISHSLPLDATFSIDAIIFLIDFILLQKLNIVTKPAITLLNIRLGQLQSTVEAVLDRSYNFYLMKYQSRLQLSGSVYLESSNIQIDLHDYKSKGQQKVMIQLKLKKQFKSSTNDLIVKVGTQLSDKQFGKFSIEHIRLIIKEESEMKDHLIQISQSNSLQNYDFQDGSFPIKYLLEKQNQISLGEKYFLELIQNLPSYTAVDTSHKKNQLYICHDMKGGYKEENQYGNPYLKNRENSYRYNYFHHTSIFNYFSHHTISIPPKHWRQLCKKYQVKCLGTFIVESGRINQKYYLTEEFAYKLVYISKKLKFDGYLLNIEDRVVDTKKLNSWLKILTDKIHQQIPGSLIVWYDSIVVDGSIQYQNQVNSLNEIYYNITDHFFTNYWWSQRQIEDDIKQLRPDTPKTIFVGNDVFGRGTYGGGQYDLYKAIDLLSEKKNQNIGICLFGQAFDYQNGGKDNNPMFKVNQNKLYRGVQSQIIQLDQWSETKKNTQAKNIYFKTSVIDLHSKKKRNPVQSTPVEIKFVYRVKVADKNINEYRVFLQIVDLETNVIIKSTGILKDDLSLKPIDITQTLEQKLLINNNEIHPNISLKILIITNDNETIAFQKQKLVISYYNSKKDWINKLAISSYKLNTKINSFFNAGHGPKFYSAGSVVFNKYDFMTDYDILHTHSINHPFQTDILFNDAFIGGSSLKIHSNKILLLKIDLSEPQIAKQLNYLYAKIVIKDGNITKLRLIQNGKQNNLNEKQFKKASQKLLRNGWKQIFFILTKQEIKSLQSKGQHEIATHLEGEFQNNPIIGQLMIYPSEQQINFTSNQQQDDEDKTNITLSIYLSFRTSLKNKVALSLDLHLDSVIQAEQKDHVHRYLIHINDDFSAFCYVQLSKCFLRQITVQLKQQLKQNQKSVIKVFDVDSDMRIKTILEQKINIRQLNQKQLSHRIQVKNY